MARLMARRAGHLIKNPQQVFPHDFRDILTTVPSLPRRRASQ